MPNIDHAELQRHTPAAGSWGNKSVDHKAMNADPDNADVMRFMKMPAGTKITDFRLRHDAMGINVTGALGIVPVNGDAATADALMAATSIAAAGQQRMAKAPIVLTQDCYIALTIGGANADGLHDVDLVLDYTYQGV